MKLFLLLTMWLVPMAVQAQWLQTNGPYGSDVRCFTSVGINLFVATSYGVFISIDTGQTWKPVQKPFFSSGVHNFATLNQELFAANDSEVYTSIDQGISWLRIGRAFGYISFVNCSDSTIYVAGDSLYCSRDHGFSWHTLNVPEYAQVNGLINTGSKIIISTQNGLYFSDDNGLTWSRSNSGVGSYSLCFHNGVAYVAATGSIGTTDIFRSLDSGETWQPTSLTNTDIIGFTAMGGTVFFGSSNDSKVYTSSDSGTTWSSYKEGLGGITALYWFAGHLFAGKTWSQSTPSKVSGFGIYKSSDTGKTWRFCNHGITQTSIYTLASNSKTLFAGIDGGVCTSSDNGETWVQVDLPSDRKIYQIFAIDSNVVIINDDYTNYTGLRYYYSNNTGLSFSPITGMPSNSYDLTYIDSTFWVGTYNGYFFSNDWCRTWSPAEFSFSPKNVVESLTGLGHRLFASVLNYDSDRYVGIFRSDDLGATWQESGSGLPSKDASLLVAGNIMFANVYNHGIFRSTDSGLTWTSLSFNDSTFIYSIVEYRNDLLAIMVSPRTSNVYVSKDAGVTWVSEGSGLGLDTAYLDCLLIKDNYLFAGTQNAGVWRRPLSEMLGQNTVVKPTSATQGIHCYPNPFSTSTTISFTPATSGYAEISIVNQLGVEVARIFSGELDAGEHQFTWQAQAPSPGPSRKRAGRIENGMYECMVRMNGRSEALPIMLLH